MSDNDDDDDDDDDDDEDDDDDDDDDDDYDDDDEDHDAARVIAGLSNMTILLRSYESSTGFQLSTALYLRFISFLLGVCIIWHNLIYKSFWNCTGRPEHCVLLLMFLDSSTFHLTLKVMVLDHLLYMHLSYGIVCLYIIAFSWEDVHF